MKERGEDVCSRKPQGGTREACFLLNSPHSCRNSSFQSASFSRLQSPFWSHHSPRQSIPFSPVWGAKCPSLFRKVCQNGESCSSYLYSKSQGGQTSAQDERFGGGGGRVGGGAGRLGGVGAPRCRVSPPLPCTRSSEHGTRSPTRVSLIICNIAPRHRGREGRCCVSLPPLLSWLIPSDIQ